MSYKEEAISSGKHVSQECNLLGQQKKYLSKNKINRTCNRRQMAQMSLVASPLVVIAILENKFVKKQANCRRLLQTLPNIPVVIGQ